jgi:hypothetical protein
MTNIKHEQWIKCDTNRDVFTRQCPSRKIFLNILYCSQLTFNYLCHTIFPRRKNDLVVRICPFDQRDQSFFPNFFFPFMNKMDGIETFLGNFFKLHDLERNVPSLGRIKNGSLNHVPQGWRGTTSRQGGGTIFFGEQLFECLTKNIKIKFVQIECSLYHRKVLIA